MHLEINNEPAKVGQLYETFRGEQVRLLSITEPHKSSSTGRVYVESANGFRQEFFPSVIGGKWIGRTDQI